MNCPERKRRYYTQKFSIILCLLPILFNGICCSYNQKNYNKNVHSSINLLAVPSPSTNSPPLLKLDKYASPSSSSFQDPLDPINHSLENNDIPSSSLPVEHRSVEPSVNFWTQKLQSNEPTKQSKINPLANVGVTPSQIPMKKSDADMYEYHTEDPLMNPASPLLPAADRVFVRHSSRKKIRLPVYTTVYNSHQLIPDRPMSRRPLPPGRGSGRNKRRRRRQRKPLTSGRQKPRKGRRKPLPNHKHIHHYPQQQQASSQLPGYAPAFVSYGPIYGPPPGIQIKDAHATHGTPIYGVQSSYVPIIHPNPLLAPPVGPPHPSLQVSPTNYPQPGNNYPISPYRQPPHQSTGGDGSPYRTPALTISLEAPSNNFYAAHSPNSMEHYSQRPSRRPSRRPMAAMYDTLKSLYKRPKYSPPDHHDHDDDYRAPLPTYGPPRPTHLYPVPVQSNPSGRYIPPLYGPPHSTSSTSQRLPPMHFGSPLHNFGPPMSSMGQPPPIMDSHEHQEPWAPPTGYNYQTYPHLQRGNDRPKYLYGAPSTTSSPVDYNNNYAPQQDYTPSSKNNYYNDGDYGSASSRPSTRNRQKYKNDHHNDDNYQNYNQDNYNNNKDNYNNNNDNYRDTTNYNQDNYNRDNRDSNNKDNYNYKNSGSGYKSGRGSRYGKNRNNNNYLDSGSDGTNGKSNYWSGKDNSMFHFDDEFGRNFRPKKTRTPWDDNNKYNDGSGSRGKSTNRDRDRGTYSDGSYKSQKNNNYRSSNDDEDGNYNYNFGNAKFQVLPSQSVAFEDVDNDKYNTNKRIKSTRLTGSEASNVPIGGGRPHPHYDTDYNSPGMSKNPKKTEYFGYSGRSKKEKIQMGYLKNEPNKANRYSTLPGSMEDHRDDPTHRKLPKLTYDTLIRRILPEHDGPQFLSEEKKIDTFKAGSEFTKMISDHDNMRI